MTRLGAGAQPEVMNGFDGVRTQDPIVQWRHALRHAPAEDVIVLCRAEPSIVLHVHAQGQPMLLLAQNMIVIGAERYAVTGAQAQVVTRAERHGVSRADRSQVTGAKRPDVPRAQMLLVARAQMSKVLSADIDIVWRT